MEEGFATIFSILPREDAERAQREVLARISGGADLGGGWIAWADCTASGHISSGGVIDLKDAATFFANSPNQDPRLADLVEPIAEGAVGIGTMQRAPCGRALHWYLPAAPDPRNAKRGISIQALALSEEAFRNTLGAINRSARPTPSEWRVAFQLMGGQSLREAAAEDGVTVDTRRAQIKSLRGRLGVHGQAELVGRLSGQLVHLIQLRSTQAIGLQGLEQFAAEYLGNTVQLVVRRLSNGRVVRCFEVGPADGVPVLLFHGLLFVHLLTQSATALAKEGLRVLMPVRPGYLEHELSIDRQSDDALTVTGIDDIASFVGESFGRPIPALGHSLGVVPAIEAARRHPKLFSTLVLSSPNVPGIIEHKKRGSLASFLGAFKDLAEQSEIYQNLMWQFRKHYVGRHTARPALRRLFSECTSDIDVLDGKGMRQDAYGWFVDSYRSSVPGIAADMRFTVRHANELLLEHTEQSQFIYARDDPNLVQWLPALETVRSPLATVLEQGGHFVCASDPDNFWAAVKRAL